MSDWLAIENRRIPWSAGMIFVALMMSILLVPTALYALASGLGILPLPHPLFLVLQRLPVAFPLHMTASGLALILIPIAAFTRHHRGIHRAAGRTAATCVAIGAVTALFVALGSEASVAARAGFFAQGLVWLALLAMAIVAIRRGHRALHARLMISMASVASAAILLRLVMAGTVALGVPLAPIYAVAAWMCWLVPLGLALIAMTLTGWSGPRETSSFSTQAS